MYSVYQLYPVSVVYGSVTVVDNWCDRFPRPWRLHIRPSRGEKGRLTAVTHVFYNTCVTLYKGGDMAVKQKRITCARCGERVTVMRGERGPASIYCDLLRSLPR